MRFKILSPKTNGILRINYRLNAISFRTDRHWRIKRSRNHLGFPENQRRFHCLPLRKKGIWPTGKMTMRSDEIHTAQISPFPNKTLPTLLEVVCKIIFHRRAVKYIFSRLINQEDLKNVKVSFDIGAKREEVYTSAENPNETCPHWIRSEFFRAREAKPWNAVNILRRL